jgi:hypothetical protein
MSASEKIFCLTSQSRLNIDGLRFVAARTTLKPVGFGTNYPFRRLLVNEKPLTANKIIV